LVAEWLGLAQFERRGRRVGGKREVERHLGQVSAFVGTATGYQRAKRTKKERARRPAANELYACVLTHPRFRRRRAYRNCMWRAKTEESPR
jgi:hypothetical protein